MPSTDGVPGTKLPAANDTGGELRDDELESVVGGQPPVPDKSTLRVASESPLVVLDPTHTGV